MFSIHTYMAFEKPEGAKVNQIPKGFERIGIQFMGCQAPYWNQLSFLQVKKQYRGSPTYTKITNTVSTTTVFGLCTCKWGN